MLNLVQKSFSGTKPLSRCYDYYTNRLRASISDDIQEESSIIVTRNITRLYTSILTNEKRKALRRNLRLNYGSHDVGMRSWSRERKIYVQLTNFFKVNNNFSVRNEKNYETQL